MTTQTTIVGTPTLPRVNLLPPEIAEARVLKQYRAGAAGAVVLAAVAVGGLYFHAHSGVAGAKASLATATEKTGALTSQQIALQKQTAIKGTVASAQATLATALAPQVLWSHYLQDMSVALAGNYWFTNLTLTSGVASVGATAPVVTPASDPSAIGSLTIQGKAVSHRDVANLLSSLAKERGISHPLFTSSSEDATPVTGTTTRLVTFGVNASVDDTLKPQVTSTGTTPSTTASTGSTAGTTTAGSTTTGSPAAGATPTTTTPAGH